MASYSKGRGFDQSWEERKRLEGNGFIAKGIAKERPHVSI